MKDCPCVDAIIAGAAILDLPVGPVDATVFSAGSKPVSSVRLYTGGDALNESIILGRLGKTVRLQSRIGQDAAGDLIVSECEKAGVSTEGLLRCSGLETGINVVLVEENGERSFITSASGSLRKQEPSDIDFDLLPKARLFMLASIFVYPFYTPERMEAIFSEAKRRGMITCADMTKRKNNETVETIENVLRHIDYLLPNREEAALITGETEPEKIAGKLLAAGVGCVVLKLGKEGCLIADADGCRVIPGFPVTPVDTTGAGDTFAAAFLCGLLEGKTKEECARFANAAGSIAVTAFGATTALTDRSLVEAVLSNSEGERNE